MNAFQSFTTILLFLLSLPSWSLSVIGHANYPLKKEDKLISLEATSSMSEGGNLGLQSRYTYKSSGRMIVDMGIGTGSGHRAGHVFTNLEYEIYPDYIRQPKFAFQAGFRSVKEYSKRSNQFLISPLLSKGLNIGHREIFPFIALPIGVSLERNTSTYRSFANINTGLTGQLPFRGYEHFLGTIEGSLNLRNSYSEILVGISYPMQ